MMIVPVRDRRDVFEKQKEVHTHTWVGSHHSTRASRYGSGSRARRVNHDTSYTTHGSWAIAQGSSDQRRVVRVGARGPLPGQAGNEGDGGEERDGDHPRGSEHLLGRGLGLHLQPENGGEVGDCRA